MVNKETVEIIKLVRKEADEDIKRHMGALNEMHGENLKAIREGFSVINNKLDSHSKILNSHTEMIGEMKMDITVLKEDVSVLKVDVKEIKKDLKKKVDYDEFNVLAKKVNFA